MYASAAGSIEFCLISAPVFFFLSFILQSVPFLGMIKSTGILIVNSTGIAKIIYISLKVYESGLILLLLWLTKAYFGSRKLVQFADPYFIRLCYSHGENLLLTWLNLLKQADRSARSLCNPLLVSVLFHK